MEEKLTPKNLRDFPNEDFENTKKLTSKEILPESERHTLERIWKSENDLNGTVTFLSFIIQKGFKQAFLALEAAEREAEEKEEAINEKIKYIESLSIVIVSKELEINELKIEIEELKSKLDISGYKGNINENLC